MDLAVITAQQVAELFILIGLGALGAKTGLLRPEGKQTLSNLLVNLVVPAMIINSYRMEFSAEILHNLMAAFALSPLSILLGLIITLLFTARSRDSRTPIFRFACVFSNAGYMGLPLISALFGSEGLLYASAFFTMFNLLLWTVGYSMVSGSSDPKKVAQSLLHCPAIYAIVVGLVLYLLQIPLPDLIVQPMELLGDMNTPLSMLITGMLIASGDLHRTLTDQHIWKLTVVRMLFIPVLTIAAFAALGLFRYGMVTQVIVLLECCPAASITSVFAVQFHHDEQFAAGSVVLTTLLSIVALALPLVFIPYLYPLFHLEGLALEIAVTMCVVYLFMLPLKAFDITNITGLLRAGGDSRMASIIDLSCQWVIAVPLTFLTALVFNAPVAVVCLCIQSENVCKCPWGILRLRSRKWINDVTGEDT